MMFDPDATLSRRRLLKGFAGTATAVTLPSLSIGCGGDDAPSTGGGGGTSGGAKEIGTVSFGSNASDPVPKAAYEKVFAAFKTTTGGDVKVNTVDHNTFQEQINSYLQGQPDDVFTWFAGYRMQFFAERGLATDINDVWGKVGSNYSDALKQASTGLDGKQYFVPFYFYPWAIFYRKSVFEEKGYEIPTTLDELKTLGAQMKKDGLDPIAFADKDGWPAMGTFDILNLRINGYDFHMQLMKGEASWQDPKVVKVFDEWRGLLRDPPAERARAHVAGGGAERGEQEVRHVPARHVRRPAVRGRGPRRSRLLQLPGDRLRRRRRHARRPDRRLHALQGPGERGGREGPARVPRLGRGPEHVPRVGRRTTSRRPTTPTRAATARCRRRPSS